MNINHVTINPWFQSGGVQNPFDYAVWHEVFVKLRHESYPLLSDPLLMDDAWNQSVQFVDAMS